MNTLKLTARDLPKTLRSIDGYKGRTFRAEITLEVVIDAQAGTCSGGTRERFFYVRLADGETACATSSAAPWAIERRENRVKLAPGFAIVSHSNFLGKDCGLRFFVHPADVARLLPAGSAS